MQTDSTARTSNSSGKDSVPKGGKLFDEGKIGCVSSLKANANINRLTSKKHPINAIVEITPAENVPGYALKTGPVSVWFAEEIHAINHAQDCYPERDIVVRLVDGTVKHRYSGQTPG